MTLRESSTTIEFAALFLAVAIVMLTAWRGARVGAGTTMGPGGIAA